MTGKTEMDGEDDVSAGRGSSTSAAGERRTPAAPSSQPHETRQNGSGERILAGQGAMLRQFIQHTPAAIAVLDTGMRYLHVSDRWMRDHNLGGQDIIGRSHYEVFPDIPRHWKEIHRRVLSGAEDRCEEDPFPRGDGSEEWLQWEALPWHREDGSIGGLIFFTQVITARKKMEEELQRKQAEMRVMIDLMPAMMWFKDTGNRILQINRQAADMVGMAVEEIEGKICYEVYPYEAAQFYADDLEVITSGKAKLGSVATMRRKDGQTRWIQSDKIPSRDKEGNIVGIIVMAQDITERVNLEERTRELAETLTTTLESITDGFFTLDREWRFTYANQETERMCQLPREALLGRSLWELFPELNGTVFQEEYTRAARENTPGEFEAFHPSYNVWLGVRVFPSRRGLGVYFHDVTAIKKAADSLRESEERFRLLAKATNDAIWDWDLITDHVWWNQGFEGLFGFSPGEIEPTIESWVTRIHPGDRPDVTASIRAAITSGKVAWSAEYRFLCRNGDYIYVLDRGQIIHSEGGAPVRMIGGMTDLTERRKAEKHISELAALIDEARDAINVLDLNHRVIFWNRGAERLFGWTAEEARGKSLPALLPLDGGQFMEADRTVRKTGEWKGEMEKRTRGGETLKVDGRWTLLKDAEGNPSRILTIDTDITERRRLEEQFLRSQRMESIGTLAGGIAHDVNNALAPIMMSIDLLKARITDPEGLDLLNMIGTSAKQGAEMVQQVLYFARGVKGERSEVSIPRLVQTVGKLISETFPRNIDLRLVVPPDIWSVWGEATQLHQVLLNLSLNARDVMSLGGVLTIAAENVEIPENGGRPHPEAEPGPHVLLRVEDTGTGMSPEVMSKIFEPFFTTKAMGQGTGLGLSTSLGIVKGHNGFLDLKSVPGKGTTFNVYLPALGRRAKSAAVTTDEESLQGRGELILVVDDEMILGRITQQTLEAHGYRVMLASEGAAAVSIFGRHSQEIAAVLTDMMMPVMDGPATILALKRIDPGIPIIAVSGLSLTDNKSAAENLGVRHFLQKPYTARAILQLLKSVLS